MHRKITLTYNGVLKTFLMFMLFQLSAVFCATLKTEYALIIFETLLGT